ncbi:MAG: bifunctional folylpolyglutamate synthase/dihydrofolate synthase, partial [Clostridia bacterium]|nr:bifunctional folylpolyglutamate synthase/dihydrofolate synthase [Clostridia bacterium]
KTYFGTQKVLLLCGVMADKDYNGMVKTLAPIAKEVFTLTPNNPRALAAAEFAEAFKEAGIPATGFADVPSAVAAAFDRAVKTGIPLISLGSLYMYCEVTDALDALKESLASTVV